MLWSKITWGSGTWDKALCPHSLAALACWVACCCLLLMWALEGTPLSLRPLAVGWGSRPASTDALRFAWLLSLIFLSCRVKKWIELGDVYNIFQFPLGSDNPTPFSLKLLPGSFRVDQLPWEVEQGSRGSFCMRADSLCNLSTYPSLCNLCFNIWTQYPPTPSQYENGWCKGKSLMLCGRKEHYAHIHWTIMDDSTSCFIGFIDHIRQNIETHLCLKYFQNLKITRRPNPQDIQALFPSRTASQGLQVHKGP